jgi:prophage regulatory protein
MPIEINTTQTRILRNKEVQHRTGLSRSTLYLAIKNGTFPAPITLGAHSVGWLSCEIDKWINCRITASRTLTATVMNSRQ